MGILLADEDDSFVPYACRAIRRQLEALLDPIRRDLENADRSYQYDAVDYLMDVMRHARASLLRDLGARHPTQWSRGAKPLPIPPELARDHQADLKLIRERITEHFNQSGAGRM